MKITQKTYEIVNFYTINGREATISTFAIKNDTLDRYIRAFKQQMENMGDALINENAEMQQILSDLKAKYSISELKTIAKSYNPIKDKHINVNLNLPTSTIKVGILSDTHIGSRYFVESWWDEALDNFKKANVAFICHSGDLVEGLSDRKGHWYDLTHIGYTPQKEYAIELLNRTDIPIYGIDGNHDRWFIKSANAMICKDIANEVPHYTFLGHDEGDIYLNKNVFIKLWHGEDGSSYATSYRIQKIIESFTETEKPNILILGHVHKAAYLPGERNIFAISAGALCKQSSWMRSKKLVNHSGYWILTINYNETEIISCNAEFFQK